MNHKIRAISEGAMMLSIISLFLLLDRQFAQFFEMMLFIASVPVVIYEVKYGLKSSVALCVSAMILGFIFSTITGMFYLGSALMIGLLYGYGVNHNWQNKYLLMSTLLLNFIATFLSVFVFASLFGYDVYEEVRMIQDIFNEVSVYVVPTSFIMIVVIMTYVAMALMQSIVTHLFSNMLLKRYKLKNIPLHSIFDVKFPKWVAIASVIGYILYLGLSFVDINDNIKIMILIYYCIILLVTVSDGVLTFACFIRLKHKGKGMLMIVLLSCFLPFISNMISIVGICDICLGLRDKMKEVIIYEIHRSN